ncbi:GNAT family N-acetyltransferase [Aquirhabdus parva]|uniref:N-acetyltransferase n=1 Tax=Aquirhabdus parva TaxID=2283318 RepID=A0A345P673_9GAMM|nr:GNAT family protein [Aquirhabdus parva]AXI02782.1 N-acetyltransferase [Aquirhabdus parva]
MSPNIIALEGQYIRLEPLTLAHAHALLSIGQKHEDWLYLPRSCFTDLNDVHSWIQSAHRLLAQGEQIPFIIINRFSNQIVGSTRYLDIRPRDHVIEIGYTWLASIAQRTMVNTEAKFLLLQYAFEQMQMRRVELKTDLRNLRSQKAIERLGAIREGILRKHKCVQNDFQRDTVYFSIIDDEWAQVKAKLLERLAIKPF